MFMIKSNGGSGTVNNIQFNNFIGHANAYSLDFNSYWSSMAAIAGDGITYSDITFDNWKGTCANGLSRAPMNVICPSGNPCTDITISDFAMWTEAGSSEYYKCQNAYGKGGCLHTGSSHTSYAIATSTIKSAP